MVVGFGRSLTESRSSSPPQTDGVVANASSVAPLQWLLTWSLRPEGV